MRAVNRYQEAWGSAKSLLSNYQEGCRLLVQAHYILEQKEKHPDRIRPLRSLDLTCFIAEYKRTTWRRVLVEMFTWNQLCQYRFRDLEMKVEAGEVPEPTFDNLRRIVLDSPTNKVH